MNKPLALSLYNNDMDTPGSFTKRFRQLRWKLTLSYTGVTVGALLTVELILLASVGIVLSMLLNSGALQADLINAVSDQYTLPLQLLLSQTPPDQDAITNWLDRLGDAVDPTIPLTFNASDQLFIVGHDGVLLGSRPADAFGSGSIGRPVNMQTLPGLAAPLQAALGGEEDVNNLYNRPEPDERVIMAVPIWDEMHERVLGVLVAVGDLPTVPSVFRSIIPIMGISFLIITLIAGIAGTIYGSVAARGLSTRLDRLSEATHAWSQGDFTQLVEDTSGDEIGQLAVRLNNMAQELQISVDTQLELAVVNERNRLARDLHDSVKQQAFAAAAQAGAARKLLKENPEAAQAHIEETEHLIRGLRQELTNLIQELRPVALGGEGLVTALKQYTEDWSRQNLTELDIHVQDEQALPLNIEQTVFRIVQETLSNIARHSEASYVDIGLVYNQQKISCTIIDNGHGFDQDEKHTGFGLRSINERTLSLGGRLTIKSTPGEGTLINFVIPINESSGGEENNLDG